MYLRGAMTLQALRTEIGDDVFFRSLRRWAQTNRDGNVSTAGFIAFVSKASGRDLTALFTTWLSTPSRPDAPPSPVAIAAASVGGRATTAPTPGVGARSAHR